MLKQRNNTVTAACQKPKSELKCTPNSTVKNTAKNVNCPSNVNHHHHHHHHLFMKIQETQTSYEHKT